MSKKAAHHIILKQGSYNIPDIKFKAFSRPFQGLNIFFKAKQNWKKSTYYEMRVAQSIHL